MKMKETDPTTSHIKTLSRVLSELSSQGINFEKEVKSLALPLSLPESWEVFCTTFGNNCPKLNLDETIGQVLTEDIRRKSMGLTIDDSIEAHNYARLPVLNICVVCCARFSLKVLTYTLPHTYSHRLCKERYFGVGFLFRTSTI